MKKMIIHVTFVETPVILETQNVSITLHKNPNVGRTSSSSRSHIALMSQNS